jgi:hypothetical protein
MHPVETIISPVFPANEHGAMLIEMDIVEWQAQFPSMLREFV